MGNSLDEQITKLGLILRSIIAPRNDFSPIWNHTIQEFKDWLLMLPASISPLTRNLELLRRLCIAFDNEGIRDDENIKSIILEGVIAEGDSLNLGGIKYEVVSRNISNRGGVLFKLRDESGKIMHHEFFE